MRVSQQSEVHGRGEKEDGSHAVNLLAVVRVREVRHGWLYRDVEIYGLMSDAAETASHDG